SKPRGGRADRQKGLQASGPRLQTCIRGWTLEGRSLKSGAWSPRPRACPMHVNDLLKLAVDQGASDLHLKVGSFPMMRLGGLLMPVTEEKRLDHEDVVAMSTSIMST